MDVLTMSDLHELAAIESGRCVSLYMPTHSAGREGQQDEVRLKNLIAAAQQQLIARGVRGTEARVLLEPVAKLPQDRAKWAQRQRGLAIFRSDDVFLNYWLEVSVDEAVIVNRRFYIKRLLPAMSSRPRFYILAVSRNRPRLLKATWSGVENLHPPDFPANIKAALNLQTADRGEQVHSGMRGDMGKEAGVFHGQGGHPDTLKEELVSYFRMIDDSIRAALHDKRWPLILIGVDYELAAYRKDSKYTGIVDEALYGSFDYVDDHSLYEQALPIARKHADLQRRHSIAKYLSWAATGMASDRVDEVVAAAHQGRIDTLFANHRAELFGRYYPETNCIEALASQTDPDADLVELTIAQTLRHNGVVYGASADELPRNAAMCAIFRY